VHCFAAETKPVKVAKGAKLSMPPSTAHGQGARPHVAAHRAGRTPAGTGVEMSNIDALLLFTRCERGRDGAVKAAAKLMGADDGDVVVGGKGLKALEVEKLWSSVSLSSKTPAR